MAIGTRRSIYGPVYAILCVVLITGGCAQTFDARTLGVETTMASPAGNPAQGDPFEISRKSVYLFFGALPVSRPSLQKVLAAQVTGDAKVADLKVRVRSRFWDIVLTGLTAGLIVPRTVTYEGVVVP